MEYKDIINNQIKNMPNDIKWWPDFLYHFTDVHNAASIIESGWIYSRVDAERNKLMQNDNASKVVIDMTYSDNKLYGRLYFRPLTPTQYHNEGYKVTNVRNKDLNACCPVPVFFLLDANDTLKMEGTKFAERGISGIRRDIKKGEEEFSHLNFSKIFHDGYYDKTTDADIKEFKHAEVVREGGFPIPSLLRCVLCRSVAEKDTLLYILKKYSLRLYNSYNKMILYKPKLKCFFNNGIFIKNVTIINDLIDVELNDPNLRYGNNELHPFDFYIRISYLREDGRPISISESTAQFNYSKVKRININLNKDQIYQSILIKIKFDDVTMYENEISVAADSLL